MNIMIPKLWSVIIIIFAVYLVILIIFYFQQAGFLYFPSKNMGGEPKHIGIPFEDVSFITSDGVKINGWYVPAKPGNKLNKVVLSGR